MKNIYFIKQNVKGGNPMQSQLI